MTGVKLEKISDIGKYLFIEKGLRGENSYIFNNLYGWAMSEFLPYGRFKQLKNVDELHELHNDYLLAPEKLAVSSDMLSKYCKEIADKYEIKVGNVKKLIPNLGSRTKYVLNYRNLQLYLSLEMKLTKIHRVLRM